MAHPVTPQIEPGEATAVDGYVVLDGPDGVAVTLSPDSAEQTGRRLISAADDARRQGDGQPAG